MLIRHNLNRKRQRKAQEARVQNEIQAIDAKPADAAEEEVMASDSQQ